jgi:beta-glucanase (GH16 family)
MKHALARKGKLEIGAIARSGGAKVLNAIAIVVISMVLGEGSYLCAQSGAAPKSSDLSGSGAGDSADHVWARDLHPPAAVIGNGNKLDWEVTFEDEFDGRKLRPCWKTSYFDNVRSLPTNGELEYYADPGEVPEFSSVDQKAGILYLNAEPTPLDLLQNTNHLPYISGMIMSDKCFAQQFGYFEIRVKVPEGKGLWPAFWLLPTSHRWPPEVDIFEMFGAPNSRREGGVGKLHTGTIQAVHDGTGAWYTMDINQYTSFHTYGLQWSPDTVTVYVDGKAISSQPTSDKMHTPMYLVANLAVGGEWVESPDKATRFPASMEIDYIRVWQFKPWESVTQRNEPGSSAK